MMSVSDTVAWPIQLLYFHLYLYLELGKYYYLHLPTINEGTSSLRKSDTKGSLPLVLRVPF